MSSDHPRLFGTGKRKKPPPDPWGPATGELVKLFCRLYKARVGEPPNHLAPLDIVTLRRKIGLLESTYGQDAPAKVAERLTWFMTHDDPYIETHGGYTIRNFHLRWDAITNLMKAAATPRDYACHHSPLCRTAVIHTQRMMDERMGVPSPASPPRLKPNDAYSE